MSAPDSIRRFSFDTRALRVHGSWRDIIGVALKSSTLRRSFFSRERLARIFAEKEVFFRSHGRVRFVRIGTRLQVAVACLAAALAIGWLVAMLVILYNQAAIAHDRAMVEAKAKSVAAVERKVDTFKRSVNDVAEDLSHRQDMLDDMVRSQFGTTADEPVVVGPPDAKTSADAAAKDTKKISEAAIPGAEALRTLEMRQTHFAKRLAALINQRAARAEAAIRSFGLRPEQIAARTGPSAQGGPYIPWTAGEAKDDDALASLAKALARLNALEQGLVAIPSGRPTAGRMLTSSYGYRRDPFNGRPAFHAGVDFPGHFGQPIIAAAAGRVSFVGQRHGYGNVVEIDHGHGIITRYAHLSGFNIHGGEKVTRGETIGRMGSTGRSTGTHLHFEVRLKGAPINPRRFLEVRKDVLQVQQIAKQRFARVRAQRNENG